jgi:hypothetical protein
MTIVDCAELEYKNNFIKKNLGSKEWYTSICKTSYDHRTLMIVVEVNDRKSVRYFCMIVFF